MSHHDLIRSWIASAPLPGGALRDADTSLPLAVGQLGDQCRGHEQLETDEHELELKGERPLDLRGGTRRSTNRMDSRG